jgi:hypothetical protein
VFQASAHPELVTDPRPLFALDTTQGEMGHLYQDVVEKQIEIDTLNEQVGHVNIFYLYFFCSLKKKKKQNQKKTSLIFVDLIFNLLNSDEIVSHSSLQG